MRGTVARRVPGTIKPRPWSTVAKRVDPPPSTCAPSATEPYSGFPRGRRRLAWAGLGESRSVSSRWLEVRRPPPKKPSPTGTPALFPKQSPKWPRPDLSPARQTGERDSISKRLRGRPGAKLLCERHRRAPQERDAPRRGRLRRHPPTLRPIRGADSHDRLASPSSHIADRNSSAHSTQRETRSSRRCPESRSIALELTPRRI